MRSIDQLYDICFIYHPDDIDFVRQVDEMMAAKDVDCLVSEVDEGKEKRKDGILRAYLVAIVLSPPSAESQTCNELIQYAVTNSKRLVTLILDEHIEGDVHSAIAENPYIFFREEDDPEAGVEELRGLLAVDSHVKLHTELLVYANHWQQSDRAGDLLLPLERVGHARQWLTDGVHRLPKPSQLQVEYIHASRRQKPKPVKKAGLSVYQILALAVLIGIVVVVGSLQNTVASRTAAVSIATESAAAQQDGPRLALATAETTGAALALADIAAGVADTITRTAQANPTATPARAQATIESPPGPTRILSDAVAGAALNQSGASLLIATQGSVSLQDIDTWESLLTLEDSRLVRMNPNGSHFVVHRENSIKVYDAANGLEQAAWGIDLDDVQDLTLGPKGNIVLVHSGAELWRLSSDSGEARQLPTNGLGPARLIRFAADGRLFATLHAERATLWETAAALPRQGYPLGLPPDFGLDKVDMAFDTDGSRLYFFVQLNEGLASLTAFSLDGDPVNRYAFADVQHGELTENGEHLLLALNDHSIQIVATASGAALSRLVGHRAAIRKLRYQPQSSRLLSADDEGRLLLWDVEAAAIDQQYAHRQAIIDFSFSHDSQRILSLDSGGIYRLWQIESLPELVDRAQTSFSLHGPTCAERQQYRIPPLCE